MRRALASAVLAAASALLGAAAQADAGAAAAPPADKPGAFQGEQLLFDVPPGWRVVQTRTFQEGEKRSRVALMAPMQPAPGQRSEQLAAMTQIHDHTPPQRYLQAVVQQWGRLCTRQVVAPAQDAVESGYRSQTQHRYCERDKRDGLCRTFVTKALGGNDSLFVVNYVKAYPCAAAEQFSAEEARRWDDYFSSVSLCDKRRDDCPADGKPVPQMST
ncbi:MAG: hypothetical protein ISP90_07170 [Nevskia sp.]|nr:hypothetical protein [Nevskia sp.]